MSRTIGANVAAAMASDSQRMAHLLQIGFDTPVYITDWSHNLPYGGNTYEAGGHLIQISPVDETAEIRTGGINVTLSGVNQTYVAVVLGQNVTNKPVVLRRVWLDASGQIIDGEAVTLYDGSVDTHAIQDRDGESQISLQIASHWSDFERRAGRRTNSNSQQLYFGDDLGLEFSPTIDQDLPWGR